MRFIKKLYMGLLLSIIVSPVYSDSVYTWKVTRILDGDTIEVDQWFYPNELGKIKIRLNGIDTPEKSPRAKCEFEHILAIKAHRYTESLLLDKAIIVDDIKNDKYGGRIVADVYINGNNVSDLLVDSRLAKRYDGKQKTSWCTL